MSSMYDAMGYGGAFVEDQYGNTTEVATKFDTKIYPVHPAVRDVPGVKILVGPVGFYGTVLLTISAVVLGVLILMKPAPAASSGGGGGGRGGRSGGGGRRGGSGGGGRRGGRGGRRGGRGGGRGGRGSRGSRGQRSNFEDEGYDEDYDEDMDEEFYNDQWYS